MESDPNDSILNDAVTVACISALRIDSISERFPSWGTSCAKNAPAKTSPQPVGSTTDSVGYAGRMMRPSL